jgi:uncharacterized protein YukE
MTDKRIISFDGDQHELFLGRLSAASDAVDEMERKLDALHLEAEALKATWSDAERDAYDTAQAAWTESIETLRDTLSAALVQAVNAGDRLRAAEEQARALWS